MLKPALELIAHVYIGGLIFFALLIPVFGLEIAIFHLEQRPEASYFLIKSLKWTKFAATIIDLAVFIYFVGIKSAKFAIEQFKIDFKDEGVQQSSKHEHFKANTKGGQVQRSRKRTKSQRGTKSKGIRKEAEVQQVQRDPEE